MVGLGFISGTLACVPCHLNYSSAGSAGPAEVWIVGRQLTCCHAVCLRLPAAPTCGPCRTLKPILNKVVDDYAGKVRCAC